jgi:hypothetical protein
MLDSLRSMNPGLTVLSSNPRTPTDGGGKMLKRTLILRLN